MQYGGNGFSIERVSVCIYSMGAVAFPTPWVLLRGLGGCGQGTGEAASTMLGAKFRGEEDAISACATPSGRGSRHVAGAMAAPPLATMSSE